MKRSVTTLFATALCGLSLCLVTAPRAHAQGKLLFTARPSKQPSAIAWVDSSEGWRVDWELAAKFRALYADTVWTLRGDGLTVAKSGEILLASQSWFGALFHVYVHGRNDKQTFYGYIVRNWFDLEKGAAHLWLALPSEDGRSWTTVSLHVDLTYAAPQPGTNGGRDGGLDGRGVSRPGTPEGRPGSSGIEI